MCSAQLFSVSFGITSKSSLQFHLPLSLFSKWTSCGPSFQSHERTLGDNWAGQTCQSCKKEAFVWPWREILRVALCFGDMELGSGLSPSIAPINGAYHLARFQLPAPMPRDQLFSVLLPGGFLRAWIHVVLHGLQAGEGSGAQQLKSQHIRSQVIQSILSLVLKPLFLQALLKAKQTFPFPHTTQAALA